MNKFIKVFGKSIFFLTILVLTACVDDISDSHSPDNVQVVPDLGEKFKVNIKISSIDDDIKDRTVLPGAELEKLSSISLKGTLALSPISDEILRVWTTNSDISSSPVELYKGNWTLTLTAIHDGVEFTDTQTLTITKNAAKTVNFALVPASGVSNGGFDIKLYYNTNNGTPAVVKGGLYTMSDSEKIPLSSLTAQSDSGSSFVRFSRSVTGSDNVAQGTYRAKVIFYGDSACTVELNQFWQIVRIKNGYTSSFSNQTKPIDLNPVSTITYDLNTGSYLTGESGVTKYSTYSADIILPKAAKDGKIFAGWQVSTNGGSTYSEEPITEIPQGSSGDKILKALYLSPEVYVSSSGTADGSNNLDGFTSARAFGTLQGGVNYIDSVVTNFSSLNTGTGATDIASLPWTVKVSGEIKGVTSISTLSATGLSLSGITGTSTDILNGNIGSTATANGTVLSISLPSTCPVTISNLKITGGNTTENGGGIKIASGANVTINGCLITSNIAAYYGAGLYNYQANTTLSNCTITANKANGTSSSGGGIYNYGSSTSLTITGGSITSNEATVSGGGIYNCGNTYISGSTNFGGTSSSGNKTTATSGMGGGIFSASKNLYLGYKDSSTTSDWTGGIYGNSSVNGGAVYVDSGTFKMNSGTVGASGKANTATNGGAIYIAGGTNEISGGTIAYNTASTAGGAIYANANFTLKDNAYIPGGTDNSNDIYLSGTDTTTKFITLGTALNNTEVATLTPSAYTIGRTMLSSSTSSYVSGAVSGSKFKIKLQNSSIQWVIDSSGKLAGLTDIYIASSSSSPGGSDTTGDGTSTKPYGTLAKAFTAVKSYGGASAYTIHVSGSVTGITTISSSTLGSTATKLTITGTDNSTDILDGNQGGSTLSVNTAVPVTIKNLKITNGSTTKGGGIYVSGSTSDVTLESGALVTGNKASQQGAGIYMATSGSKLTMNEGSEVSSNSITATSNGSSTYGGAGAYVNTGTQLILDGGTISDHSLLYGMRGAGVFVNGGTLKLNSGKITKNTTTDIAANVMLDNSGTLTMTGGEISYGQVNGTADASAAGVWINENSCSMTMSGGTISNNTVKAASGKTGRGAGITVWTTGASLTITGGTISNNKVDTTSSSIALGGAIYVGSTCKLSNAYIPYGGSENSNDIYLSSGKTITLTGNLSSSHTTSSQMAIIPQTWSRGTTVVDGSSYISSNIGKIKTVDADWFVVSNGTGSSMVGKIDNTNMYVSASGDDDTGRGTSAKPYLTINKAVTQCWNSSSSYTINVVGTLTGAQTMPAATTTTGLASAITLKGTTTSATLNGGFASGTSSATLTISTAVPVTIQSLTIKGGTGAGLSVTNTGNTGVTLGSNTTITSNIGTNYGGVYSKAPLTIAGATISSNTGSLSGGVYMDNKPLTMTSGTISGNTATETDEEIGAGGGVSIIESYFVMSGGTIQGNSSASCGGGVCLNDSDFYMSGSAVIGDSSKTTAPGSTATTANKAAKKGGGIWSCTDSSINIGYIYNGSTKNPDTSFTGGVYYNYCTLEGGGIYSAGSGGLNIAKGNVSYNAAGSDGGGAYVIGNNAALSTAVIQGNTAVNGGGIFASSWNAGSSQPLLTMNSTAQIKQNTASGNGGGVYLKSYNLCMTSKAIIGETSNSRASDAEYSNKATGSGGGVYMAKYDSSSYTPNLYLGYSSDSTSSTSALTSGYGIVYNRADSQGGGLYCGSGTVYMNSGDISANSSKAEGGGVHIASGTTMTMSNGVISLNMSAGASDSKGGGVYCAGTFTMAGGTIGATTTTTANSKENSSNYTTSGAGIHCPTGGVLNLNGGVIGYNYSNNGGGGIYAQGKVTVKNTVQYNGTGSSGNGAGMMIDSSATSVTVDGATFTSNVSGGAGGAILINGTNLNMKGAVSMPSTAAKNNDINLGTSGAITITGALSGTGTVATLTPYAYSISKQVLKLGTGSGTTLASESARFKVTPQISQTWTVSTTGYLAMSTEITSSNIESFTPEAGKSYNFVMGSDVTENQMKGFLEKLCTSTKNTSETIIGSSTLDLSKTNLTSFGNMSFDYATLVEQPFTKVILPATDCSISLSNYRVRWCLIGVQEFIVPSGATSICSSNGVVYNTNKTKIIAYPASREGSYTWPSSVTEIGSNAFSCTKNLTAMDIPNTVTTFNASIFDRSKITSLKIPSSVTSWSEQGFWGCEDLKTVEVHSKIIPHLAFGYCSSLETIVIGSEVEQINQESINSCNALISITFNTTTGWHKADGTAVTVTNFSTVKVVLTTFVSGASYSLSRN